MINIDTIQSVYFIGAGGIGMSALIRYFLFKGRRVGGYDRVPTALTEQLIAAGATIHYTDNIQLIKDEFKHPEHTLVVYTPAVSETHTELIFFRTKGFAVLKRSEVLGLITNSVRGLCIAGTHGKTTTSSMTAHLLKQSHIDCNAFLGGILKQYETNLMLSDTSDLTVIEADEYDRSFHQLSPYMAVITYTDPDHLDIYGTPESYRESFEIFTSLIRSGGALIMKSDVNITPRLQSGVRLYTYSASDEKADFYASNICIDEDKVFFDFVGPSVSIENVRLGVPVEVNIENGVAAMALACLNGVSHDEIKRGMASFAGVSRRFDFLLKTEKTVLIDDYAHHPKEVSHCIRSVRKLYPKRKITGIFQPHLYSRTRDFAADFAESLSLVDELILLDIYPAREEPISGITSQIIFDRVTIPDKKCCSKTQALDTIVFGHHEVVLTIGAGDIDQLAGELKLRLEEQ